MLQTIGYSTTKVARNLRTTEKGNIFYIYIYIYMYIHSYIYTYMCIYIWYLVKLPVPEEHLLPFLVSGKEWLFASGNMTVSSRFWRSETISTGCLSMHPFLFRCYRLFSAENGCR